MHSESCIFRDLTGHMYEGAHFSTEKTVCIYPVMKRKLGINMSHEYVFSFFRVPQQRMSNFGDDICTTIT